MAADWDDDLDPEQRLAIMNAARIRLGLPPREE